MVCFDVVILVLSVASLYVLYLECETWKADRVLPLQPSILNQAGFRKSQRPCFHTRGRVETKTTPARLIGID